MKIQRVPRNHVDLADRTFAFRRPGVPDLLRASIERFSVLHPPVLRGEPGRWQILSGRRRIEASREDAFTAWTVSADDLPPQAALERLVEENRFLTPFTAYEAGTLLALFRDATGASIETLSKTVAPRLGVPSGRTATEARLAVASFPDEILDDPVAKDGVLLALAELGASQALRLWRDWVRPRRPSVQQVRQAVTWLLDLEARDGVAPAERLGESRLRHALEAENGFLPALRALRFPVLWAVETAFAEAAGALPEGVQALLAPRRDDDTVEFRFRARSPERAKQILDGLAGEETILEALFEALWKPLGRNESSSNPPRKPTP